MPLRVLCGPMERIDYVRGRRHVGVADSEIDYVNSVLDRVLLCPVNSCEEVWWKRGDSVRVHTEDVIVDCV